MFHQAGFGEKDAFARARTVMAELLEAGQAAGALAVATRPLPPTSSCTGCTASWSPRPTTRGRSGGG
jgi:hypothetical protein